MIRRAAAWALAASLGTALVSALARALCLPPYWVAQLVFRCRPEGVGRPLLMAVPEAAITALLFLLPSLLPGAAWVATERLAARRLESRAARVLAAAVAGGLWFAVVARMEPSPIDAIVSAYAEAAGALAGALAAGRVGRRAAAP